MRFLCACFAFFAVIKNLFFITYAQTGAARNSQLITRNFSLLYPFQKPRQSIQLDRSILFFYCSEAAVEESKVAEVAAFEIEEDGLGCVVFYEGVDEEVGGAEGATVRVVAYEDVVGPVVREEEYTGGKKLTLF